MNETAEATTAPEQEVASTAETNTAAQEKTVITNIVAAQDDDSVPSASTPGAPDALEAPETLEALEASSESSPVAVESSSVGTSRSRLGTSFEESPSNEAESSETGSPEDGTEVPAATESNSNSNSASNSASDSTPAEIAEGAKKTRAPRTPKAPAKPAEASGSIGTIVERVVRMTTLSDDHAAALGRLFNVSLPEDYVARLTRLTGASLGPIGSGAAEALAIVLGLESANPIHVGVQLGRLAAPSLPDVYRCAHALTGETAPALPKGDNAVFAVADVLATLTADDFALARALSSALE
jgi:hypothetical protein